jgi:prepilin-type N-terminal cleavage/methylation domain-containing protein
MNSDKGTTLIEVVIVMAIISVFLGSVCGVIGNFLWSSATGENFLTVSRKHERAMSVIREELFQTSADMNVPKFWIYDEHGFEITYVEGTKQPGTKIRFKKFSKGSSTDSKSFELVHIGSTTVGRSNFFAEVEFWRDPDTNYVLRSQHLWDEVAKTWGEWSEPQVISSYCTELTFTELPVRRIEIIMTNEVGDPQRSYVGVAGVPGVDVPHFVNGDFYSDTVEVTPWN